MINNRTRSIHFRALYSLIFHFTLWVRFCQLNNFLSSIQLLAFSLQFHSHNHNTSFYFPHSFLFGSSATSFPPRTHFVTVLNTDVVRRLHIVYSSHLINSFLVDLRISYRWSINVDSALTRTLLCGGCIGTYQSIILEIGVRVPTACLLDTPIHYNHNTALYLLFLFWFNSNELHFLPSFDISSKTDFLLVCYNNNIPVYLFILACL